MNFKWRKSWYASKDIVKIVPSSIHSPEVSWRITLQKNFGNLTEFFEPLINVRSTKKTSKFIRALVIKIQSQRSGWLVIYQKFIWNYKFTSTGTIKWRFRMRACTAELIKTAKWLPLEVNEHNYSIDKVKLHRFD